MPVEKIKTATIIVPSDLAGGPIQRFRDELGLILKENLSDVVLDCSRLEQVTSSHIGLLWGTCCQCQENGVTASLESLTPELIQVLKVLDLYDVLVVPSKSGGTVSTLRKAAVNGLPEAPQTYVDEFRPTPEAIDEAISGFLQFLSRLGLPDITKFELRTVFYEWATNIRSHGKIAEDERVVFLACTTTSKITMVFADSGMPFDPTAGIGTIAPGPAAENLQKRGFGLNMICKMTDSMRYNRQDDVINVLTLEKNWSH